jgi:hypothetical protein
LKQGSFSHALFPFYFLPPQVELSQHRWKRKEKRKEKQCPILPVSVYRSVVAKKKIFTNLRGEGISGNAKKVTEMLPKVTQNFQFFV